MCMQVSGRSYKHTHRFSVQHIASSVRLEPARALLNNPPFISAKIPSHIWDFFFFSPTPLRASSILPASLASHCQQGPFCTILPACTAFGNIWGSAGSWVRRPYFQPPCSGWTDGTEDQTDSTGTKGRK